MVKSSPSNVGDIGSIPESGGSPEGGNGNPLQYCLENSMDRGAWQAAVHGVAKSWLDTTEQLLLHSLHFRCHPHGKEMQKSNMAVWEGLANSCEKERSEKQRRKGKI